MIRHPPNDATAVDVLVLGGGAAGICAAVAARRAGAEKVVVLKKAEGATAMSSGAVDVADGDRALLPTPTRHAFDAGMTLEESIERLAASHPRHPYARVAGAARERMSDALSLLQQAALGLRYHGGAEGRNLVVATQLGTVKRTALTQESSAFDLSCLPAGGRVLVVELEDVAGFDGGPVAAMLRWIDGLGTTAAPHSVEVVSIPAIAPERTYASPRLFAAALRHEGHAAFVEHIVTHLQRMIPPGDASVALLPPVLGLDEKSAELCALLATRCGFPVVELLALPQSAPGARLSAALERGAQHERIEVLRGDALGAVIADNRVREVRAVVNGEECLFEPRSVVLATGRFLAGGLQRTGTAREPIFDLP
ncbi:MAG: FAD-binding protein, partial [Myxococcota bacterium]